jgi:methyltransferase family protein
MSSDERTFRGNMARFHDGLDLRVIAGDSRTLAASALPKDLAFAHVDGGHSAAETFHDVSLAAETLVPGGLVAVDDYFNPSFPGVSEGVVRFLLERPGALVPVAIGHNKVLFQRAPASDLHGRFAARYPRVPRTRAAFAGAEVFVFGSPVAPFFDLERSTPEQLVARDVALKVDLSATPLSITVPPGVPAPFHVRVRNRSDIALGWSDAPFGLSYHLTGASERYENPRVWFTPDLAPGEERTLTLAVMAPETHGRYEVEIDVVWEGICWLRERGNAPARVTLEVR